MNLSADFAYFEITLNFEALSEKVIMYFNSYLGKFYK